MPLFSIGPGRAGIPWHSEQSIHLAARSGCPCYASGEATRLSLHRDLNPFPLYRHAQLAAHPTVLNPSARASYPHNPTRTPITISSSSARVNPCLLAHLTSGHSAKAPCSCAPHRCLLCENSTSLSRHLLGAAYAIARPYRYRRRFGLFSRTSSAPRQAGLLVPSAATLMLPAQERKRPGLNPGLSTSIS